MMNLFKIVDDYKSDFTTFPRTFKNYKWYKPILVFVIGLILYLVVSAIAVLILGIFSPEAAKTFFISPGTNIPGFDKIDGAISAIMLALMIPSLYISSKIVNDRPFSSYLTSVGGWNWGMFIKSSAVFLIVYIIFYIFDFIVRGSQLDIKLTLVSLLLLIILTPFQCFAEELVFRGLITHTLGSWFRIPIIAIVIPAILFACAHGYNTFGFIDVLVSGLIFAFLAWYTKGLEVSTALHSINNIAVFTVAGISTVNISTNASYIDGIEGVILTIASFAVIFLIDRKYNFIGLNR